jgi:hypothetical protein
MEMAAQNSIQFGDLQTHVQDRFTIPEFEILKQVLDCHGYTISDPRAFIRKEPDCDDGHMIWNSALAGCVSYGGVFHVNTDGVHHFPCVIANGKLYRQYLWHENDRKEWFEFLFRIPGISSSDSSDDFFDIR